MKAPFKVGDRVLIDAVSQGWKPRDCEGKPATVVRLIRLGGEYRVHVAVDDDTEPCRACRQPVPRVEDYGPDCLKPLDMFTEAK